MRYLFYIFIIFLAYLLNKKPMLCIPIYSITISLSPLITKYNSEIEYYFSLILLFVIILRKVILANRLNYKFIMYAVLVIIYIMIQKMISNTSVLQVILSFYRYIIIPFVVYYGIKYTSGNKANISKVITPYFAISLLIFYYRALVDYSFFGAMNLYRGYESYYSFGNVLFRPSNLSSPIIFSIELAIFLALLFHENGFTKKVIIFNALSIYPLIAMKSRNGLMLYVMLMLLQLLWKRRYKLFLALVALLSTVAFVFRSKIYLFSIFNFSEQSYALRFSSISESLRTFFNYDIGTIIFGSGVGSSNMYLGNESYNVYVENFYISLLNDAGIVLFILWVLFNFYVISIGIKEKKKAYVSLIMLGLLVSNFLASNLTAYTVQIIYWIIVFTLVQRKRHGKINLKHEVIR